MPVIPLQSLQFSPGSCAVHVTGESGTSQSWIVVSITKTGSFFPCLQLFKDLQLSMGFPGELLQKIVPCIRTVLSHERVLPTQKQPLLNYLIMYAHSYSFPSLVLISLWPYLFCTVLTGWMTSTEYNSQGN